MGILFIVGTVLTTLIVIILFCRHRLAIRKKSFYLIALAGTVTANMIFSFGMLVVGRIYAEGSRMFSSSAWKDLDMVGAMLLGFIGTLFSILPALAVAYYYEKRSKKNEEGKY